MLVTAGNKDSMLRVFGETFGEPGDRYRFIFYPLSNHGMLPDPVSERCYDKAVEEYCSTYFGY